MEGRIPYIEIVPCKEEEPTNDAMNLRGRHMSDFSYFLNYSFLMCDKYQLLPQKIAMKDNLS